MLKYRPTTEADVPILKEWMAADQWHKDWKPEFWVEDPDPEKSKGIKCLAVSDAEGVVFFLRLQNVMRVFVQFPPKPSEQGSTPHVHPWPVLRNKVRVSVALKEAFGFISNWAKSKGYREMTFDSTSDLLIAFFKRLGFEPAKDFYKVELL